MSTIYVLDKSGRYSQNSLKPGDVIADQQCNKYYLFDNKLRKVRIKDLSVITTIKAQITDLKISAEIKAAKKLAEQMEASKNA